MITGYQARKLAGRIGVTGDVALRLRKQNMDVTKPDVVLLAIAQSAAARHNRATAPHVRLAWYEVLTLLNWIREDTPAGDLAAILLTEGADPKTVRDLATATLGGNS